MKTGSSSAPFTCLVPFVEAGDAHQHKGDHAQGAIEGHDLLAFKLNALEAS